MYTKRASRRWMQMDGWIDDRSNCGDKAPCIFWSTIPLFHHKSSRMEVCRGIQIILCWWILATNTNKPFETNSHPEICKRKKKISKKERLLNDKFHSRRTHSARQRILFLNRFHDEPATRATSRVQPLDASVVHSAKNNRREFYFAPQNETNEWNFFGRESRRRVAIGRKE